MIVATTVSPGLAPNARTTSGQVPRLKGTGRPGSKTLGVRTLIHSVHSPSVSLSLPDTPQFWLQRAQIKNRHMGGTK